MNLIISLVTLLNINNNFSSKDLALLRHQQIRILIKKLSTYSWFLVIKVFFFRLFAFHATTGNLKVKLVLIDSVNANE